MYSTIKRKLLSITMLLCVVAVSTLVPAGRARADSVTDTISIHIGYFGWDEDQFVEKATFHWRDLDDMFGGSLTTHEIIYSYFNGSRTYHAAARGFYIRDLLEYAGIDFGSISRIDFFTKDQTVGPYRSFTKSSLFDMPRYYFPYLASDEVTNEVYAYHGGDLYDGATRVEAMLALEDYTVWDSVGYMFEESYDSTMYSTGSRFHLFFGQLSPEDANTSSAAKYVYKLFITFTGTPVLSTDETNIELKVGNDFRMIVNVSAEDRLLDEYVAENLKWSSDNESVVAVDAYGNLTVRAEGEALITAMFGQASVSAVVRVGPADIAPPAPETATGGSAGAGSGGAGSGGTGTGGVGSGGAGTGSAGTGGAGAEDTGSDGTADGANPEDFDADEEEPDTPVETPAPAVTPPIPPRDEAEDIVIDDAGSVFLLSAELMSREEYAVWVSRVLGRNSVENSGDGALSGSRAGGMGSDAVQLILPLSEKESFLWVVAIATAVFFVAGFGYGAISFKRRL